jgi:exonuclease VII small subunit
MVGDYASRDDLEAHVQRLEAENAELRARVGELEAAVRDGLELVKQMESAPVEGPAPARRRSGK